MLRFLTRFEIHRWFFSPFKLIRSLLLPFQRAHCMLVDVTVIINGFSLVRFETRRLFTFLYWGNCPQTRPSHTPRPGQGVFTLFDKWKKRTTGFIGRTCWFTGLFRPAETRRSVWRVGPGNKSLGTDVRRGCTLVRSNFYFINIRFSIAYDVAPHNRLCLDTTLHVQPDIPILALPNSEVSTYEKYIVF